MGQVKFSVFSDLHLSRGLAQGYEHSWMGDCEERLEAILSRAEREGVDFIIHCGDFCHDPIADAAAVERYNRFSIPTYHTLGNHDMDKRTLEETVAAYEMPGEYYYFDKNGFRFIVLNENYFRYEGEDIAYSKGNYFKFGPYRDVIPKKQVEWLEETVMSSPYPMVIFSHASLEREDLQKCCLKNREEVQDIFRRAHKAGKRILMCINGHLHMNYMRIYEHVCYLDLNSASMFWMPTTHHLFPDAFHETYFGSKSLLIYNDPVHAIVTLSDDGMIKIEGMESSFFCDVDAKAVLDNDCSGTRKITPNVLSETLWLPIKLN
jgi:predicted phosphodiesterase